MMETTRAQQEYDLTTIDYSKITRFANHVGMLERQDVVDDYLAARII